MIKMFDSSAMNDEDMENTQIIAKIFSYLDPGELRAARLLNFAFNKIIITHPNLFWAKNVFRVRIRSCENDKQFKKEWAQLRLHKLITDYNCPNIHFVKTDLLAPGAMEFFHSSVRYQIKHLQLTKCHVTSEILIHILACTARKLEHLEIDDFSKFVNDTPSSEQMFPALEYPSKPYLFFPCLATLILSGKRYKNSSITNASKLTLELELPRNFLYLILSGSCKLQKLCFLQWNARTCQRFTKSLGSIDPEKLQNVRTLELECSTNQDLNVKQQYGLLKPLGSVCMPNLRKLRISFDKEIGSHFEGFSIEQNQFVETITNSLAILVEGAADAVESIELVNCPVTNNVFRSGINSFKNLCNIDTRGSFVTQLDDDAKPTYEYSIMNTNLRCRQNGRSGSMQTSNDKIEIVNSIGTKSGNLRGSENNLTRVEVYKIICAVFIIVALIHMGLKWAVGSSYIGGHLEIVIYAVTVFGIMKNNDLT